ncbi:MAG TPA: DAK2 domain-containing protein [Actinophytocola sp.]|nr:DAK2 domain-containing protein [Actinophytocola sp.]
MLQALDAAQVRRWAVACVQSLDAYREEIDRINVFPVPDSDTGSNLLHTMRAALDALLRAPASARTDAGAALTALARGALAGARGNSGVIASQLLRGLADALTADGERSARRTEPDAGPGGPAASSASTPDLLGRSAASTTSSPPDPTSATGGPADNTTSAADKASGSTDTTGASGNSPGSPADSTPGSTAHGAIGSAITGPSHIADTPGSPADSAESAHGSTGSATVGPSHMADAPGSTAHRATGSAAAGPGDMADAPGEVAGAPTRATDTDASGNSPGRTPGGTAHGATGSATAGPGGVADAPGEVAGAPTRATGTTTVVASAATEPAGLGVVTGARLRVALAAGAQRAAEALSRPVDGTMVSVLAAAAAAAEATGSDELGTVVEAAAAGAAAALEETPRQLAVLAEAGVVDAGGRGVVVLLEALVAVVAGRPAGVLAAQRVSKERVAAPAEHSMYTARESGSDVFAYEVMYLLEDVDGAGDPIGRLRDSLVGLGDCVSVVGDGAGLWTVHVHCNDVGAAIEVGVETGRPRQIRVARFADAPSAEASRYVKDRAVVVPVRGNEFGDLLVSEGVTVVPVADPDDAALAYHLLEAITGTGASHVSVLPADAGLIEVADEAAIRAVAAGQDVVVVPCASPVQVLAAVAVHDPRRRAGDDVVAMAEAAAATRRGEVVVSAETAITWIGPCAAGDVLGFADGEVVLIEPGPPGIAALDRAACGVVERLLGMGGELVTVLLGAGAPDELAEELTDYLRREHPETELVVYHGGQTDEVLILGVE